MAMPYRIMVNYERKDNPGLHGQEDAELTLMRIFNSIGYDLYMTHERVNQESGMPERTLEFVERF
jgi:hypothetical protein